MPEEETNMPKKETKKPDEKIKSLGIIFHKGFTFLPHVENLITKPKKVAGKIGRLCGVMKGVTRHVIKRLYKTCVRPILKNESMIWYGLLSVTKITKIQRTQSNGTCKILGAFISN